MKMNFSRLITSTILLCALPAWAQPEQKPPNGLPYPLVTPEEAARLTLADTPFSLHLHDVTLEKALEELGQRSGVSLDTTWGDDAMLAKKLSLDLETRSFSEAFGAVLDGAKVKATLQQSLKRGTWRVMFDSSNEPIDAPQSGAGPFQVDSRSRRLRYSMDSIFS